jgi:hypothetical protein
LVENRIILIGGLGYPDDRRLGYTPVFALNTQTYRIERLETTGKNPGWIFNHSAALDQNERLITVSGGEIQTESGAEQTQNAGTYELNLRDLCWRRL